jgi:DNA mismatch repair protein MutS
MGLALLDLSTGEFLATQFQGEAAWTALQEQLDVFTPSEILYPSSLAPLVRVTRTSTRDQREHVVQLAMDHADTTRRLALWF